MPTFLERRVHHAKRNPFACVFPGDVQLQEIAPRNGKRGRIAFIRCSQEDDMTEVFASTTNATVKELLELDQPELEAIYCTPARRILTIGDGSKKELRISQGPARSPYTLVMGHLMVMGPNHWHAALRNHPKLDPADFTIQK